MRRDYHIHPTVLQIPERFDEFVSAALAKNIKEICVTDHMPLSISKASDRIPHGCVKKYCESVRELSKKYEGIIGIKCGIEIDYHPTVKNEIEAVLLDGDFDLVLASSHMHLFVDDCKSYTFSDVTKMALQNYLLAIETGLFDVITHFDMYRWMFEKSERYPLVPDKYEPFYFEPLVKEVLCGIKDRGMRLEINPHLAESKKDVSFIYPQDIITKWAVDMGVLFTYGSDAHKPTSVGALLDELEADALYGVAIKRFEDENG